jgi:hypothetical protein
MDQGWTKYTIEEQMGHVLNQQAEWRSHPDYDETGTEYSLLVEHGLTFGKVSPCKVRPEDRLLIQERQMDDHVVARMVLESPRNLLFATGFRFGKDFHGADHGAWLYDPDQGTLFDTLCTADGRAWLYWGVVLQTEFVRRVCDAKGTFSFLRSYEWTNEDHAPEFMSVSRGRVPVSEWLFERDRNSDNEANARL